jgi:hypothetical protein
MRAPFFKCFFFLLLAQSAAGQNEMFQQYNIPVSQSGVPFKSPWVGGLNNPEFSPVDLNNDGILDLVIFDRVGDVLLTYLNENVNGQSSYTYAPEYECNFPKLKDFVLLRDYNKDGAADIFCAALNSNSQEMQVFTGYFDNNMLKFKPFKFSYPQCPTCTTDYIWFPSPYQPQFWDNMAISRTDIPAIDDIDGDGDLDILFFPAGSSTNVWWLKNNSVEKGWGLDSLHFTAADVCWGGFYENGLEPCKACLSPAAGVCCTDGNCCGPVPPTPAGSEKPTRHPGATLTTLDLGNTGKKDLIFGNISFSCMGYFTNGGTPSQAWMTAVDTSFPKNDVSIDLHDFPASYYLDLDNDGKKDLVITPNSKAVGEDRKNVWFYKNTGDASHPFQLENKRLMVEDMIDFGSATHPAFADVNGDGLLDMIVGNYGFFTTASSNNASLYLFLNTGTPTHPAFNLVDSDWLNMSQYAPNDFDFAPAFGDIDGDGDLDLLIGSNLGSLYCFRNQAGPDAPMVFQQDFNTMWVQMDVGQASTPAIVDLNQDGLPDILMGERSGNINYFKNIGSSSEPIFASTPTIQKLGAVNTQDSSSTIGFSTPVIAQTQTGFMLVTGTQLGYFQAFNNITATATAFSPLSLSWGNLDEGNRSSPALADLDNDGMLELVSGNLRGGLSLYKTKLVGNCGVLAVKDHKTTDLSFHVAPNPSDNWVRVSLPPDTDPAQWRVFNSMGQIRLEGTASGPAFSIQVHGWEPGIYFLEVSAGGRHGVEKMVVKYQN